MERARSPGRTVGGVYGKDERAAFTKIRAAVDAKKPITASTKRTISDPDNQAEQERGLAGEAKVSGLASAHAYTVLDYDPHLEAYPQGQQIKIKLRNPWGSYGRKYEQVLGKVKGVADNGGNGIFWIDLADLVAYFDDLAISG